MDWIEIACIEIISWLTDHVTNWPRDHLSTWLTFLRVLEITIFIQNVPLNINIICYVQYTKWRVLIYIIPNDEHLTNWKTQKRKTIRFHQKTFHFWYKQKTLIGWIPRNFKIFIFKPKMSFLKENHNNNPRIHPSHNFKIFNGNSHYENGHFQENDNNDN